MPQSRSAAATAAASSATTIGSSSGPVNSRLAMVWLTAEYGEAPNRPPWSPLRRPAEDAKDRPAMIGTTASPANAIIVRSRSSWVVSSTRSMVVPFGDGQVGVLERLVGRVRGGDGHAG